MKSHRGRQGRSETIEADVCLVAIGVMPVLPDGKLKLEATDRGYFKTNDRYETSVEGIFAAGDIIGPPWLAHVASCEAVPGGRGHVRAGIKPKKVRELSRLHLLPAAGREHRTHRDARRRKRG